MTSKERSELSSDHIDSLYNKVISHIDSARQVVNHTVNSEMVKAYWLIGQEIVVDEQSGHSRAEYGQSIIQQLSIRLKKQYGKGFSVDVLERTRNFYLIYHVDNPHPNSATVSRKFHPYNPALSWSHYVELIRIPRDEARCFYQVEAVKNRWSVRELKRQVGSLLYDRISKSKDTDALTQLASEGQEIIKPRDAIKDPLVLEFLGIPASHKLIESHLEQAIIDNLQHFLLELGTGFAFIGRQQRLSFDGDHYYADLVFYHVILKCYVIIDIKTKALSHGDLGQMLLYVNYYDQEIKATNDNPTIGLVLCTQKSDMMVKYTLGDKAEQIFASRYQLHLPTEEELEIELRRELAQIEDQIELAPRDGLEPPT